MNNLTYVTGNYGKYISVKELFEKNDLDINFYKCDLDEPDVNDIKYISLKKALKAYEIIKRPVFVADSGFYINAYPNNPGYPGAFVKRSGISTNIEKLIYDMKNVEDRSCYFLDCLTFYDGDNYYQFFGSCYGNLAYEIKGNDKKEAQSNLWKVFIPNNCTKTLAEMTKEERENRCDGRTSAKEEFIKWYKKEYKSIKKLHLTM